MLLNYVSALQMLVRFAIVLDGIGGSPALARDPAPFWDAVASDFER